MADSIRHVGVGTATTAYAAVAIAYRVAREIACLAAIGALWRGYQVLPSRQDIAIQNALLREKVDGAYLEGRRAVRQIAIVPIKNGSLNGFGIDTGPLQQALDHGHHLAHTELSRAEVGAQNLAERVTENGLQGAMDGALAGGVIGLAIQIPETAAMTSHIGQSLGCNGSQITAGTMVGLAAMVALACYQYRQGTPPTLPGGLAAASVCSLAGGVAAGLANRAGLFAKP